MTNAIMLRALNAWDSVTLRLRGAGEVIPRLVMRIVMGWEFWESGLEKLHGENWFADIQDRFPVPFDSIPAGFSWQIATWFEIVGGVLLWLGLGTRFVAFSRGEWSRLRDQTPLLLTEADLFALRGLNDQVTLSLVEQIYLPLARLLNLYVAATQTLHKATDTFLNNPAAKVPYVIGVAGSVAVGKSTTARILQALLSQWPDPPHVDLVTTDGFLHPNAVLESRGLMQRKGFPESYDVRRLLEFLIEVKSGKAHVAAPVYSHLSYDIVPNRTQDVNRPDRKSVV